MNDFDPMNPQARHMADESMIRTLRHQADAIWPQERPLFERYGLRPEARILDVGCGTGGIALRLAIMPVSSSSRRKRSSRVGTAPPSPPGSTACASATD